MKHRVLAKEEQNVSSNKQTNKRTNEQTNKQTKKTKQKKKNTKKKHTRTNEGANDKNESCYVKICKHLIFLGSPYIKRGLQKYVPIKIEANNNNNKNDHSEVCSV